MQPDIAETIFPARRKRFQPITHLREPGDESISEGKNEILTTLEWVSFEDIQARPTSWLWKDRIPKGKLVIFAGNPDVGKSTASVDVIANYTTGRNYPDGALNQEGPREALMVIAEDNEEDTVKPRLIAAGADLKRVRFLRGVRIQQGARKTERALALDTDLHLLEESLRSSPGAGLVVIDPITSYIGRADMNKEQELRRVFGPIRDLAQKADVTILGLGHFNKRVDVTAIHRVGGAVAMSGIPRMVWLFVKNEDGDYSMLLGKGNLTRKRSGLKYKIVEKIVDIDGAAAGAPIIQWLGDTSEDADAALAVTDTNGRASAKARKFLKDHFAANPGAQASAPIIELAAKQGITSNRLFDARKELSIKTRRVGTCWYWEPEATFQ